MYVPPIVAQFRAWLLEPATTRLDLLGEAMSVTQADLDNIAAGLVSTEGSLQQAIARLEADIADGNDLDLSGIREAASGLAALVPSETGGGEGPVATDPSAPVVDGSGSEPTPEPAPEGDAPVDGDQPA